MVHSLAVVTTVWGVVMALAPMLQVRVILRRRTSAGFATGWLVVLSIGFALWLAYGVATASLPLVVSNSAALVVALATLAVAHRYRPGSRHAAVEPVDATV